MKKTLLLILVAFLMIPVSKASHVVGGDFHIQWVSATTGGANYHIKLRAYRDDVNGIPMPTSITVGVYDAVTHAQVATQILNKTNPFTLVPLGDPCYTPDSNVVRIEEGIFESPANLLLANNPNGYYIQGQINARNSLAINVQTGGTMSWFAMIPDPALGQNSSPDFGDYPNDAYFCITGPKQFSYPITDADGDSLAYSFVQPLDAWTASNGTFAGSGAYPFYPGLNWAGTFNLGDIIGGPFPMNINPTTGLITAQPAQTGFFTFAIRVEEFRNSVKIGETRRDVQYISLNCTSGSPPTFLNVVPKNGETIQIPYNEEYCKDLIFNDINATDTLFFTWSSPIFDSGAYQANVPLDINGDKNYYYNWNGNEWGDTVIIPPNQYDTTENAEWNIGTVAQRFCWTPDCDDIGGVFPFQVNAYSLGCDGKSQDSIIFNIEVVPPNDSLDVIPNVITPNGDGMNDVFTLGYINDEGVRVGGVSNPCVDEITVEIFNRWGTKVYEGDNPEFTWDGTNKGGGDVPAGTYFVLIHGIYGSEIITLDQRTVTVLR